MDKKEQSIWAWRILLTLGLSVTGWLANNYANQQKDFNKAIDSRMSAAERNALVSEGNRFTSVDWFRARESYDASFNAFRETMNALDKRITRNEDTTVVIKSTLERMEKKIDSLPR